MASACVNNLGMSPDTFLDCPPSSFPSCGWIAAPRRSFTRDDNTSISYPPLPAADAPDPASDAGDFEFQPHDPVAMLPADELFSDGKLVPLQRQSVSPATTHSQGICSPESAQPRRLIEVLATGSTATNTSEAYLFSPKAPRCSSRWRELLGLKKSCQPKHKSANTTTASAAPGPASTTGKSIRQFLHRNTRSASFSSPGDSSLSLPLLRDSDCESASACSSRASRSSSSSGHDVDDLRRLSVDTDKPRGIHSTQISLHRSSSGPSPNPPKVRLVKPRLSVANHPAVSCTTSTTSSSSTTTTACRVGRSPTRISHQDPATMVPPPPRGLSVDSPRMNSSGKVVFQGLERSSSSPSSLNGGGARYNKYRGMDRSYSANVRITPFLNVPVCSLRGSSRSGGVFGFVQLFSSTSSLSFSQSHSSLSLSQKKDGGGGGRIAHHLQHGRHQQTTATNWKGRKESATA